MVLTGTYWHSPMVQCSRSGLTVHRITVRRPFEGGMTHFAHSCWLRVGCHEDGRWRGGLGVGYMTPNPAAPLPRSPHRSPRAANGAAALFAATTRRLSGAVTLVCVCERCLTCFYDIWGRTGSIVAHAAPRTAVPSRRPPNGEPRVSAAAPVRPCHATVGPWRLRRGFLGSGRSEYTTSRC